MIVDVYRVIRLSPSIGAVVWRAYEGGLTAARASPFSLGKGTTRVFPVPIPLRSDIITGDAADTADADADGAGPGEGLSACTPRQLCACASSRSRVCRWGTMSVSVWTYAVRHSSSMSTCSSSAAAAAAPGVGGTLAFEGPAALDDAGFADDEPWPLELLERPRPGATGWDKLERLPRRRPPFVGGLAGGTPFTPTPFAIWPGIVDGGAIAPIFAAAISLRRTFINLSSLSLYSSLI